MLRLREIRKESGISLKKLGEIIGVAESTMSLYENEKRQPDYETLKKLADYFNVTTDYLLGREESPKIIGKDEKEIEKIIENTIENLSNTDGLMFDGEVPATEEEIEQLKAAMRIGLAMAKEKARQKFTPKKYRKDNQTDNK